MKIQGLHLRLTRSFSLLLGMALLLTCLSACATEYGNAIPVTGGSKSQFVVKEYPLVEQSKDNPTHSGFQNWVPKALINGHGASVPDSSIEHNAIASLSNPGVLTENSTDFNQQTIDGKQFFMFAQNGQIYLNYNGQVLPVSYDEVVHGNQGELSIFNPGGNHQVTWFYALRDGLWYYVEAGYLP